MEQLIEKMRETMNMISSEIHKTENKAAMRRVRKATLEFQKLAKVFRKNSKKATSK